MVPHTQTKLQSQHSLLHADYSPSPRLFNYQTANSLKKNFFFFSKILTASLLTWTTATNWFLAPNYSKRSYNQLNCITNNCHTATYFANYLAELIFITYNTRHQTKKKLSWNAIYIFFSTLLIHHPLEIGWLDTYSNITYTEA